MSVRRLHLFLLFFTFSIALCGQKSDWKKIGLEEGLPTTAINNMVQGPEGFIWMASEGAGLIRYDGYSFETFFLEDFPVIEKVERSWRNERLYFHDGSRIAEYNGLSLKEISINPDQSVLDIINAGEGLYVALSDGLYHWDGDSLVPKSHLPKGFNALRTVGGDLLAECDSAHFLFRETWEPWHKEVTLIKGQANSYFKEGSLASIAGEPVPGSAFIPPPDGGLSFAEGQNYFSLKGDSLYYAGLVADSLSFNGLWPLPGNLGASAVNGLFYSKGRVVLISNKGLFLAPDFFQLQDNRYRPILSLEKNKALYLGTPGGLVAKGSTEEIVRTNGLILASTHLGDSLFIATESGLLYRSAKDRSLKMSPVNGFVFSLVQEGARVWAAASSGIWKLEEGTWSLEFKAEDLGFASIFSSKHQSQSGLWFASYTKGIWNFKDANWTNYREIAGIKLDSIGISAMQPLPGSRLAIGTLSNGLFIFDMARNRYDHYRLKDLEFAEIRAFDADENKLWIGTNKGVLSLVDIVESRKAGESGQLHFMGLPVSGGCLQLDDLALHAGGESGYYRAMLPAALQISEAGKLDLLEAEFLQDQDLGEMAEHPRAAFSGTHLFGNLDYDQNYLRFRYGMRTLFYPELVQYRYRLKGQTENWTYAGTNREALFSDLKAGTYTLEVQARYPWQFWEQSAATYTFHIHQAIWRTIWFWLVIGLLLAGLLYLYVRDRWQRQKERLKLENDLLEMERKALRLQMNPHFIFNALDSISSFIFKKDPKMAVRYLNNFAKLMRLTLESSMEHIHPVETEVSILKNYLELEKLRFSGKFDYEIELDEELDYTIGLPPMLIQPHVENAILHGLKPKTSQGFLQISFKLEGESLCCTIEDDGIGREKAKDLPNKKAHRSMATQINKDRIDLLRKSVDELIDLKIIDKYNQQGEACGTKVIIRLPAQEL